MIKESPNYAEVLVDSFASDLENQTFTYQIPENLKSKISLGTPVVVPFGRTEVGGYIVSFHDKNKLNEDIKIKKITSANLEQMFSEEYISTLKWLSEYYHSPFINVLKTAIPSGILTKAVKYIELIIEEDEFLEYISFQADKQYRDFCNEIIQNEGPIKVSHLKSFKKCNQFLKKLKTEELIEISFSFNNKIKHRTQYYVSFLNENIDLTERQSEVLKIIKAKGGNITLQQIIKIAKTTTSLIRVLEKKGAITLDKQIKIRTPQNHSNSEYSSSKLELNQEQKIAYNRFIELQKEEKKNKILLLHGVTGSGKTEVYLQTIEHVLLKGKISIVLVPEISLTPQTVSRFRNRFGDCIAVLHSALGDGERFDEWQRIKNGIAKIIIGARSAVFAPCKDIGLIIIDEEHESSYKQDRNPRYNAKRVAMKRAELNNATIILGSATPDVESYFHAKHNKKWELLELKNRVENRILPKIKLIDMRKEFLNGNKGAFSRELLAAMEKRLEKKEQSIIFINRRGFSTSVLCRTCGYNVSCEHCSVSMVYHSFNEYIKCHYCGEIKDLPKNCPKCRSSHIRHFGMGTQKIEQFAQSKFPNSRIARLDRDTTTRKNSHQKILSAYSRGEYDILIGTQMVAKGLDFPNVTLVGIIAADTALNIPDFRAGEKAFQLLTQVAGRSGRGDTLGEVIAQSYSLEHFSIKAAQNHDFLKFYNQEIADRKELIYPPYSKLVNIIIADQSSQRVKQSSKILGNFFKKNKTKDIVAIMGPIPAALTKIKTYYRYQILIKTKNLDYIRELLYRYKKELDIHSSTNIGIDIEPLTVL